MAPPPPVRLQQPGLDAGVEHQDGLGDGQPDRPLAERPDHVGRQDPLAPADVTCTPGLTGVAVARLTGVAVARLTGVAVARLTGVADQSQGFGHRRAAGRVGGHDGAVVAYPGQTEGHEVSLDEGPKLAPGHGGGTDLAGDDHLIDQLADEALTDQLAAGRHALMKRVEGRQHRGGQARQLAVEREAGQGGQVHAARLAIEIHPPEDFPGPGGVGVAGLFEHFDQVGPPLVAGRVKQHGSAVQVEHGVALIGPEHRRHPDSQPIVGGPKHLGPLACRFPFVQFRLSDEQTPLGARRPGLGHQPAHVLGAELQDANRAEKHGSLGVLPDQLATGEADLTQEL